MKRQNLYRPAEKSGARVARGPHGELPNPLQRAEAALSRNIVRPQIEQFVAIPSLAT